MKHSFYFDHDYNARNDQKVLELRAEYGWAGYGVYFAVIECLCESDGEIKRGALAGLSVGLSIPKGELIKMVDFMVKIDLLVEKNSVIFSNRIKKHLEFRAMLSEAGRRGGRGNKKPPFSPPLAPLEAGKERKGKKKDNNIIYPSFSEVELYFTSNGYRSEKALDFYNYYTASNWVDKNNNNVKNWKQKAQSVWFKEENKIISIKPQLAAR